MTKTVVNNAPYSIPDHNGNHIAPGAVADVETTPAVRLQLDAGRLVLVSNPPATAELPESSAPRRRSTSRED